MKKPIITLSVIFSLYITGFFIWAPLAMISDSYNMYWLSNTIGSYSNVAYKPIVNASGRNGVIYKLSSNNTKFWCSKFEGCNFDN